MKPFMLNVEQFSEDPGDNFLQFLFMSAAQYRATDIYLCPDKDSVRIFKNYPGTKVNLDDVIKLYGCGSDDFFERADSQVKIDVEDIVQMLVIEPPNEKLAEKLYEDMPVSLESFSKLEGALEKTYRLKDISELEDKSPLRDLSLRGIRVGSGLCKFSIEDNWGYHIKINYLE